MREKDLTELEKRFTDIYIANGLNHYEAYRAVYSNTSEKTAKVKCSVLRNKVKKSKYFSEKLNENSQDVKRKHNIDRDFLINENIEILNSAKQGDFIPNKDGGYTKSDRHSALKALDQLAKITGSYYDFSAVNFDPSKLSDEELEKIING